MKYERFAPSGCKNIGIRSFKSVAKTQFLLIQKCFGNPNMQRKQKYYF